MYRRPLLLTVALLSAVACGFALLILPREADRALRAQLAELPPLIDTLPMLRSIEAARMARASASDRIDAVRLDQQRDSQFAVSIRDATGVARVVAGDTLREQLADRLRIARTTRLVDGYLSLAEAAALVDNTEAQALADSLRDAERERSAIAALGGADPRFLSLQQRVQQRVQQLGDRLDSLVVRTLYEEVASVTRAARMVANRDSLRRDSTARRAADDLRSFLAATDSLELRTTALRRAREWNAARAQREQSLRVAEPLHVPTVPMLAATLLVSLAIGYVAALIAEVRDPRVADLADVASIVEQSGLSASLVMALHGTRDPLNRRDIDRRIPPVLRHEVRAMTRLHLTLSAMAESVTRVGVVGDDPEARAAVTLQLGTAAAQASRAVLVIDADVLYRPLGSQIDAADRPGLAEVARERIELAAALMSLPTGRERAMLVLTGGQTATSLERLDAVAPELDRLMDRHDLTILALPPTRERWPTRLMPRDVVLIATAGQTSVLWFRQLLKATAAERQRVRAVLVQARRA